MEPIYLSIVVNSQQKFLKADPNNASNIILSDTVSGATKFTPTYYHDSDSDTEYTGGEGESNPDVVSFRQTSTTSTFLKASNTANTFMLGYHDTDEYSKWSITITTQHTGYNQLENVGVDSIGWFDTFTNLASKATSNSTNLYTFKGYDPTELISNTGSVCFLKGTNIATDQGIVKVEDLTREHTMYGARVNNVTEERNKNTYMMRFKRNSLGKNVPSEDTIMTPTHAVVCPKTSTMKMAKDLCNGDTIVKDYSNKKDSKVYNILLEDDNGKLVYNAVNANNMICESLSPCVYGLVTNKFKFEEKLQEEDKNNIEDYNEHRLISLLTV